MKKLLRSLIIGSTIFLVPSLSFAGHIIATDNSGLLVGLYLGFCALIIVLQLIPAITLLFGMLKGMMNRYKKIV